MSKGRRPVLLGETLQKYPDGEYPQRLIKRARKNEPWFDGKPDSLVMVYMDKLRLSFQDSELSALFDQMTFRRPGSGKEHL